MGKGVVGTKSNVASSATAVDILAANPLRKRFQVFNDSSAILYLDETGGTPSASSYTTQIAAGGYYESAEYCAVNKLTGLWASANGNARVTDWQ